MTSTDGALQCKEIIDWLDSWVLPVRALSPGTQASIPHSEDKHGMDLQHEIVTLKLETRILHVMPKTQSKITEAARMWT